MTALLFAELTLRELVRRRLAAAIGILTLAIAAFTAWGMSRLAGATANGAPLPAVAVHGAAAGIVMVLAFFFSFVVALGAALIAAPALGESVANGEILALLARPIRRVDVLAGRWLGAVAALWAYVALAGGVELAIVRAATGYAPPHPLVALLYLGGEAAVVATAAIALAARLPPIAAGAIAAVAFGIAWIGGIVEAVGAALGNAGVADAGTIVGLLFPSDALWRGALYALQPAVLRAATATGMLPSGNPFSIAAPPPPALVGWALAWIAAVFAAGALSFRRRDL